MEFALYILAWFAAFGFIAAGVLRLWSILEGKL